MQDPDSPDGPEILGVIPAIKGTIAEYDKGTQLPVIGWIVTADGYARPLILRGDGVYPGDEPRWYDHPDFSEPS